MVRPMMKNQKVDSEGARKAFEVLQPRLDQLTELRRITVDVERAAALAAAIGRAVQKPEVRSMFAQLPAQVFDMRHVDELELAGLATWHAVVEHARAQVGASRSKVPPELVEQAVALKQRMLTVADYHLGHDQDTAAQLANIRQGKGYTDLAADLLRLGRIYEANQAELVQDRRYYRASDRHDASALAHRIYEYVGQNASSDAQRWAEYVQRAWTFMVATYEEVSAAGRWLYRHDSGDDRFPSLFSSVRQPPRSRTPDAMPEAPLEATFEAPLEATIEATSTTEPQAATL
jgi:hypothetical protein